MDPVLLTRILCDFVNKPELDATHLMGQTTDNQESVISRAIKLIEDATCRFFTIMDEKISGYPGGRAWEKEIYRRSGIKYNWIGDNPISLLKLAFPLVKEVKMSNSYGEAIAAVAKAKQMHWKRIAIVAQPIHQLRSFLGFVGGCDKGFSGTKSVQYRRTITGLDRKSCSLARDLDGHSS